MCGVPCLSASREDCLAVFTDQYHTLLNEFFCVFIFVYIDVTYIVADSFGVGAGVDVTLSCLHNILLTSGWSLTIFSLIYNWDIIKNWLDSGDLDLTFKVKVVEKKLKLHGWGISVSLQTPLLVYIDVKTSRQQGRNVPAF